MKRLFWMLCALSLTPAFAQTQTYGLVPRLSVGWGLSAEQPLALMPGVQFSYEIDNLQARLGVDTDFRSISLDADAAYVFYLPEAQPYTGAGLVVRGASSDAGLSDTGLYGVVGSSYKLQSVAPFVEVRPIFWAAHGVSLRLVAGVRLFSLHVPQAVLSPVQR